MGVTLTKLEEAILDAQDIAAGLAISARVQELVERSTECRLGYLDRELPSEIRTEALRESRSINQQLALVATLNEINHGIEA